jgi:uncharacterized protein
MERAVFDRIYNGSVAEGNAIVLRYIRSGKDINVKNYEKKSLLNVAARMGLVEGVQQLIKAKADLNSIDNEGSSALSSSLGNGYVEIVKILIKSGADVNIGRGYKGKTPFMSAVEKGNLELIDLFLKAKVDLSIKDEKGQTALDYAKESGRKDLIDLLSNQRNDNSKKGEVEDSSSQSNEPIKEENNIHKEQHNQAQEKKGWKFWKR